MLSSPQQLRSRTSTGSSFESQSSASGGEAVEGVGASHEPRGSLSPVSTSPVACMFSVESVESNRKGPTFFESQVLSGEAPILPNARSAVLLQPSCKGLALLESQSSAMLDDKSMRSAINGQLSDMLRSYQSSPQSPCKTPPRRRRVPRKHNGSPPGRRSPRKAEACRSTREVASIPEAKEIHEVRQTRCSRCSPVSSIRAAAQSFFLGRS